MDMERKRFNGEDGDTKQIQMFFHCKRCVEAGLPNQLEVGWTAFGIQVWCRAHDINIAHVDFTTMRPK